MSSFWNGPSLSEVLRLELAILETTRPACTVGKISLHGTEVAGIHAVELVLPADATACISDRLAVVFLSGYGGASAWFLHNLYAIGIDPRFRVFALDHLGTGASSRTERKFPRGDPIGAEAYFVESLEAWRNSQGFEQMAVIGHSLGGYIAGCYALNFPQRVAFLGLTSPAGMPDLRPPPEDPSTGEPLPFSPSLPPSYFYSTVRWLWEADYTPHGLIRMFGSWGGRLWVKTVMERRVARWVLQKPFTPAQQDLMAQYVWHYLTLPSGAEFALNAFLYLPKDTTHLQGALPGHFAAARRPLASRIRAMAKQSPFSFPVLVSYGGSHDWMRTEAGPELVAALQGEGGEWAHSTLVYVPHAGHHCYLENPDIYNSAHLASLRGVWERRSRPTFAVHMEIAGRAQIEETEIANVLL